MSDTSTIDMTEETTRVPLRDRAARETPKDDEPKAPIVSVTEAEPIEQNDDDRHLADITKTLQNKSAESDANAERARIADQGRIRAERALAAQTKVAQTSRQALVAAAIENAKSELGAAKAALKVARDSGDIDAETNALAAISGAAAREANAKAELATFQNTDETSTAGRMTEPGGDTTQRPIENTNIPSRSQAWIGAHPRFNTDPAYKSHMLAEHYRLEGLGVTPAASPDKYYASLDAHAARLEGFGDSENGEGTMPDRNATRQNGERRQAPFQGARPNGNGTAQGNAKTYRTPISELKVTTNSRGVKQIVVPKEAVEEYKEFANVNNMEYDEYVRGLVEIEEEKANGTFQGTITHEGGNYK